MAYVPVCMIFICILSVSLVRHVNAERFMNKYLDWKKKSNRIKCKFHGCKALFSFVASRSSGPLARAIAPIISRASAKANMHSIWQNLVVRLNQLHQIRFEEMKRWAVNIAHKTCFIVRSGTLFRTECFCRCTKACSTIRTFAQLKRKDTRFFCFREFVLKYIDKVTMFRTISTSSRRPLPTATAHA